MSSSSYARSSTFLYLILAVLIAKSSFCFSAKVYVVYMGSITDQDSDDIVKENHQILASLHSGSIEQAQASHIYSYRHGFRGFAAILTDEQVSEVSKMEGVVSVFPNTIRQLQTTRSWDFVGLVNNNENAEVVGHSNKNQTDIIVGIIDSGIWPESPSFRDTDLPPVQPGWKGKCQLGEEFNASSCNRKLIGARYYTSGLQAEEGSGKDVSFKSPRDSIGHGTHTASTAAGRYVENMNFDGLAAGGGRGGAPLARIAVYKTCWESGCYDVDLLAAFDDAIRDGVHIISLSVGGASPQADYFQDAISLASFHAARNGVLVVASAGNEGNPSSATNLAPWIVTVGASSIDREFSSDIILGNGANITGTSLSLLQTNASTTIISGADAFSGDFTPYQSSYCLDSSLNATKAKDKILVCRHVERSTKSKIEKSKIVQKAGGVGLILIDETKAGIAVPFVIPGATVTNKTGEEILSYIKSTSKPTSRIFGAKTVLGTQPAPRAATFSSKGPNTLTPEILKPDITAPGLNILAAWSPVASPGNLKFSIISGTSMSCPHVTGISALVKAVHPSWSPSAIKSAIMTTATILDNHQEPITADSDGARANAFDYGSGLVNPTKALDPGLVYDSQPEDFVAFLCSLGYDEKSLRLVTRDKSICDGAFKSPSDLNYPSIAVPNLKDNFSVTRVVTNVGAATSTYEVEVVPPAGVNVTVVPNRLVFTKVGQKIKFTVNFKVVAPSNDYSFGLLSWKNGKVQVNSPLVVRVAPPSFGSFR